MGSREACSWKRLWAQQKAQIDLKFAILFLVKLKGVQQPELVAAKEANVCVPQDVIKFYESRLCICEPCMFVAEISPNQGMVTCQYSKDMYVCMYVCMSSFINCGLCT